MNLIMELPLGQLFFNLVGFLVLSSNYWLLNVDEKVNMPDFEEDTDYTQMLMYVFLRLASFICGGSLYFNG